MLRTRLGAVADSVNSWETKLLELRRGEMYKAMESHRRHDVNEETSDISLIGKRDVEVTW